MRTPTATGGCFGSVSRTPARPTPCSTSAPTGSFSPASEPSVSVAHRLGPGGDAPDGRGRLRRGALRRPPEGGPSRARARAGAGAVGTGGLRACRPPRGAKPRREPRAVLPRRGYLRPLRACGGGRHPPARRVPDRLHAVPAGDEPGRPAGDLRVPDRHLRADRDGRL